MGRFRFIRDVRKAGSRWGRCPKPLMRCSLGPSWIACALLLSLFYLCVYPFYTVIYCPLDQCSDRGGGAESDQGVCQSDARRARPTTSRYINYPGSVVVDLDTLKTLLNKTFILCIIYISVFDLCIAFDSWVAHFILDQRCVLSSIIRPLNIRRWGFLYLTCFGGEIVKNISWHDAFSQLQVFAENSWDDRWPPRLYCRPFSGHHQVSWQRPARLGGR